MVAGECDLVFLALVVRVQLYKYDTGWQIDRNPDIVPCTSPGHSP